MVDAGGTLVTTRTVERKWKEGKMEDGEGKRKMEGGEGKRKMEGGEGKRERNAVEGSARYGWGVSSLRSRVRRRGRRRSTPGG